MYLEPVFADIKAIGYRDQVDPLLQAGAATWYAFDWGVWFIGLAAGIVLLAALARPVAAYVPPNTREADPRFDEARLTGFSILWVGQNSERTPYHYLHISTSLAWLLLLLCQLVLIRQNSFRRHRAIGISVFIAGPLLVASLMLLSVHSAAKEAAAGHADDLFVQNVGTTLKIALLFLGIALFFTFISFVPGFKIDGPETFSRFAKAGQTISIVILVIGLLFFLRNW